MTASRTVLVLSSDPAGPVVRHRFAAFAPGLAASGITLELGAWPKDKATRRATLERASTVDAVVVSSRLLAKRHVRTLRDRARRLAFDFDDALPFRDSRRGATASATRGTRFRAIVEAADRVTAGNAYLRDLAASHGAAATVIPTVVPTPQGEAPPEPDEGPVRLGWIGARATLPYLESAGALLAGLAAEGRAITVRAIADAAPAFPAGIMVDAVPWRLEDWEAMLRGAHIGFAPLPDDAWTRGKCGLKVLQMMAAGRPVVASPVGVQSAQVTDGATGFLGATDAALAEGLGTLLDDPTRRRAMGEAAFADVRARWSVDAWSARVVAEMERLLAGEGA